MNSFTEYKEALARLKTTSIEQSIQQSEHCWELYPSKLKSHYNSCAKEAVKPYHIFCDGKRRLRAKKQELRSLCSHHKAPESFQQCMTSVFQELIQDIQSLENKLHREQFLN